MLEIPVRGLKDGCCTSPHSNFILPWTVRMLTNLVHLDSTCLVLHFVEKRVLTKKPSRQRNALKSPFFMANSELYTPSTRAQSGLTGQTASLTSRRSLSPGAAGCRLEYGLHELAMCTVMSVKVKEARRVTIESKPDTLGAHGSSWSTSVSTGSVRYLTEGSEHQRLYTTAGR